MQKGQWAEARGPNWSLDRGSKCRVRSPHSRPSLREHIRVLGYDGNAGLCSHSVALAECSLLKNRPDAWPGQLVTTGIVTP